MITRLPKTLLISACLSALSLAACGDGGSRGVDAREGGDDPDGGSMDHDAATSTEGGDHDGGALDWADDDAGPGDASAGEIGDGDAGDGDGGDGDAVSIDACAAGVTKHVTQTDVLTFEAEDLEVVVARYGNPNAGGTPGTIPWLGERFGLSMEGETVCITEPSDLTYANSHHNYDDRLEAVSGDRTYTFTQKQLDFESPNEWTVSIEKGGSELLAPVKLTLVTCKILNTDADCSKRYLGPSSRP